MWECVKEKLPEEEGIVWVMRESHPHQAELAYFRDSVYRSEKFQDPLAVRDMEGLEQEYYTDVLYWMELEYPNGNIDL
jgi:hypothetical protein